MVSYPSGFSKTEMEKILPMSIVSTLSANHAVTSAYHSNSSSSSNPRHLIQDQTLRISSNKSQHSHLFDPKDLSHRLCQQKSRLIRLYDLEIERRQTTPQLITFINKIEQLIDQYENQVSNNLLIGNSIESSSTKLMKILLADDPANTAKQLDDVLYSTYFNGTYP